MECSWPESVGVLTPIDPQMTFNYIIQPDTKHPQKKNEQET